jgi:hypothetical protein
MSSKEVAVALLRRSTKVKQSGSIAAHYQGLWVARQLIAFDALIVETLALSVRADDDDPPPLESFTQEQLQRIDAALGARPEQFGQALLWKETYEAYLLVLADVPSKPRVTLPRAEAYFMSFVRTKRELRELGDLATRRDAVQIGVEVLRRYSLLDELRHEAVRHDAPRVFHYLLEQAPASASLAQYLETALAENSASVLRYLIDRRGMMMPTTGLPRLGIETRALRDGSWPSVYPTGEALFSQMRGVTSFREPYAAYDVADTSSLIVRRLRSAYGWYAQKLWNSMATGDAHMGVLLPPVQNNVAQVDVTLKLGDAWRVQLSFNNQTIGVFNVDSELRFTLTSDARIFGTVVDATTATREQTDALGRTIYRVTVHRERIDFGLILSSLDGFDEYLRKSVGPPQWYPLAERRAPPAPPSQGVVIPTPSVLGSVHAGVALAFDTFIGAVLDRDDDDVGVDDFDQSAIPSFSEADIARINEELTTAATTVELRGAARWKDELEQAVYILTRGRAALPRAEAYVAYYVFGVDASWSSDILDADSVQFVAELLRRADMALAMALRAARSNSVRLLRVLLPPASAGIDAALLRRAVEEDAFDVLRFLYDAHAHRFGALLADALAVHQAMPRALHALVAHPESLAFFERARGLAFREPYAYVERQSSSAVGRRLRAAYGELAAATIASLRVNASSMMTSSSLLVKKGSLVILGTIVIGRVRAHLDSEPAVDFISTDGGETDPEFIRIVPDATLPTDTWRVRVDPWRLSFAQLLDEKKRHFASWRRVLDAFVAKIVGQQPL